MALNSSLPPHQVVQKLALQQTAQLRLGIQALLWSFLLTPLLFLASPAEAQTSWKGTISSDWNTAGNWTAGVPTSRRDVIIGDSNFTGPNQPSMNSKSTCKSLVVGTGSIACVLSVSQTLTVLGDVTIGANGRINHNTRKGISVTGNWTNLGIYSAGQVHASVAFSGANQIITGTTTFNRLNINAGSKVILNANITVNNQLNISGTLDPGESPTFTVSGNTRFALNSGGTLLVKAATFAGNYAVTGSKSFSANATIEYGATVLNQTVANNLTYGTLRISGALTKTLGGNLPALSASSATSGNIFVIGGTFDLSTFSADRAGGTVGGTLSIANGATLRIGGTHTFPANYKIHTLGASSTVEYSGTAQLVSTESYGNLTLSSGTGAAVKTMTTNAMTIAGNLSSVLGAGTAVSFTAAAPLTVRGNVLLGPATTFNAGSFAHSFGASWTNNGTFAGGTGSAAFTGSSAALSGSGTNNFNNLTLTGAGITAASGTSLNVAGNFSTSGAGTFQHSPAGPGAATLTGVARTISGNSIVFNHLNILGSVTVANSLTIGGDLNVSGNLAANSGIITVTGPANIIGGNGVIALNGLTVQGSISSASSFSLKSDLAVAGTLTATAGTVTFNGSSIVSGAPNLFNVALIGARLQLGANSVLGIAGNFAVNAGTFDTSTTVPNTVNYNASGAQTILATTYDNLSFSTGGSKTAGGVLLIAGDLNIGAGTSFSGGSFTHSLNGNWLNNGAFLPGTGSVQLAGGADSAIFGATTFGTLSLNKLSSNNVVTLGNDIGVSTLNMTSGTMLTGPNSVTITSDRTGNGIILGTITRSHAFTTAVPYAFESPNNTVVFSNLGTVTSVTVQISTGPVTDFPRGSAVNRQYTFSLAGSGPYLATLRLHYEGRELNGNYEPALNLYRFEPPWTQSGGTARNSTNHWVEQSALSDINGRWALADAPNVVAWVGSVSTAWENAANWNAVQGTPDLPPGTNELVALATTNFINPPTLNSTSAVRSIFFGDAKPLKLTLGPGASLTTLGDITGSWTNSAAHTIDLGSQALNVGASVQMSDGTNGHTIDLTLSSGSFSVAGNLIQNGGANLNIGTSGILQVAGDFIYQSGAFTSGSGTVIYNGASAQNVAGGITYNNLIFDKTGGTATLTNPVSINASLLLSNAGTFQARAPLAVSNGVVILTNAVLDGSGTTISVGGNWTNRGAFTPGTGTLVFYGTNDQTIEASTFNNLIINKATHSVVLSGNLVLNGDLDVAGGTLDLAGFSARRSSLGGTLTLSGSADLRIGTGSGYPLNFVTSTLDPDSTVEYSGASSQSVAANAYGNLYLSNGGAAAKTLAGDSSVAGDLVINGGATLDGSSFSLTLQGNWTNNGSFVPSSSSVVLGGAGKNLSGPSSFNNLAVTGSYSGLSDIGVNGIMNVSGLYLAGNSACMFAGDFQNVGTFITAGTTTFAGTAPQTLALNLGFVSLGTLDFDGSVSPAFNSLSPPTLQTVVVNNAAGIAPDIGWVIQGDFLVNSAAAFNGGSQTHTFDGNFTNLGNVGSAGTLVFNPLSPVTLLLGGPAFSSGSVIFGGSGPITFGPGPQGFNIVVVTNSSPTGLSPAGNWTLSGGLYVGPATTLNAGAGLGHGIAGDLTDDGVFNGETSAVTMSGTADPLNGATITGIGTTTFNHLTVSGVVGVDADFGLSGNFTNNGAFDGTGSTVTFQGSTTSILAGTNTPIPFDTLVISKTGAVTLLNIDLGSLNALTVAGGTLDSSTFAIGQNPLGGVLAVNAAAVLRLGGATTLPVFSAYSFDPAGTVEYYGVLAQTITPVNYGNLLSTSTGARTLPSGATIGIAGTFTPGGNSYTNSGSTVNYNGPGAQTMAAFNYFNLVSSASGNRVLPATGTVGIAGTFTPAANVYTVTGSTVSFNGPAQTIPPFTFDNLTIAGSGTKTLAGNITVQSQLDIAAGFLADGGFIITAQGDVINQTTCNGTGELLLTGGSGAHGLSGGGTYGNLELSDTNGAALNLTNLNINGGLTFTAGVLHTATNIVILGPTGRVTRVSGHVVGNLRKPVASGASVTNTFEIGDTNNYSPVTLLFTNVTTQGNLTAKVTFGEHPDMAHSGLSPARNVNRYWTITNSGTAFGSYQATFNFVPGDILDPFANASNFVVAKLDGTNWTLPTIVTRTAASVQARGMTNFSAFAIGERIGTNLPVITAQPQSQRINSGSNATFTVTVTGVGPLDYQWTFNGNFVLGATSSSLTLTNVQDAVAGNYAAVVNNGGPLVTSSNALLTINHPPVMGSIPDQTVSAQTNLSLQLSATDPDGGTLTFLLVSGPQGMTVSPSGLLTWTPAPAQRPSSNPIAVQVQDDGTPPLSSTTNFTVVALDTNHPPVLVPVPPQTNFAGVTLIVTNSASDPDAPPNHLTFSLSANAPAGAAIDPNTGLFTWTLPGPNGSYQTIAITVTDDGLPPLSASQPLTVAIEPASAPEIVSIELLPNSHSLLSITGTPNQLFWIQAAARLGIPSPWTNIGTNTIGLQGTSQFEDAQTSSAGDRFYRLAVP